MTQGSVETPPMFTITSTFGLLVVSVSVMLGTAHVVLGALKVPEQLLALTALEAVACAVTLLLVTLPATDRLPPPLIPITLTFPELSTVASSLLLLRR